jgi:hypothetical protein
MLQSIQTPAVYVPAAEVIAKREARRARLESAAQTLANACDALLSAEVNQPWSAHALAAFQNGRRTLEDALESIDPLTTELEAFDAKSQALESARPAVADASEPEELLFATAARDLARKAFREAERALVDADRACPVPSPDRLVPWLSGRASQRRESARDLIRIANAEGFERVPTYQSRTIDLANAISGGLSERTAPWFALDATLELATAATPASFGAVAYVFERAQRAGIWGAQ